MCCQASAPLLCIICYLGLSPIPCLQESEWRILGSTLSPSQSRPGGLCRQSVRVSELSGEVWTPGVQLPEKRKGHGDSPHHSNGMSSRSDDEMAGRMTRMKVCAETGHSHQPCNCHDHTYDHGDCIEGKFSWSQAFCFLTTLWISGCSYAQLILIIRDNNNL